MSTEPDDSPTIRPHPATIGRYEIVQPIGHGGMGTLFLARDPKIGNRHVVIKVLREGFDSPESRERFAREANAAGALHHINIVTIFDVGDVDGQPFIAMEYVQGETLTELVRRRAHLPLGRKIQLMEELCAGLHYAHRAGVVHRDIKPANMMVDRDGALKILDFGIARFGASKVTRTGIVVGTLNYMAPEQLAGQKLDPRADMFSAGAVFYELFTGRQAFPAQVPAIFQQIMLAQCEPIESVAPDLNPDLVKIVTRCLACNRDDRYPDMAAVRKELALVRQRVEIDEQQAILRFLDDARAAIDAGNPDGALQSCREALVLDSECLPALELQTAAHALSKKQQIDGHLAAARTARAKGALTSASLSVDLALAVDADSAAARAERDAIAVERRRIAEERERAQNIADALGRARQALQEEDPEGALRAAAEALAIDPDDADARALKAQIDSAIAARREAERAARERAERQQQVRAALERAKAELASDAERALRTASEALKIDPEHTAARLAVDEIASVIARRKAEQEARDRAAREQAKRERAAEEQRQRIEREAQAERTVTVDRVLAEEQSRKAYEQYIETAPVAPTIVLQTPEAAKPVAAKPVAPKPTAPKPAPVLTTVPPPAPIPDTVPIARPQRSRMLPVILAIAAAAIVVAAIVIAVRLLPRTGGDVVSGVPGSTGSVAPGAGTLVIDAVPWARIVRVVNAKGDVQQLPDSSTPVAVRLPAGDYRIELSGPPPSSEHREVKVTVGPNATQVAPVVTFVEMSVDEYFRSQTGGSR